MKTLNDLLKTKKMKLLLGLLGETLSPMDYDRGDPSEILDLSYKLLNGKFVNTKDTVKICQLAIDNYLDIDESFSFDKTLEVLYNVQFDLDINEVWDITFDDINQMKIILKQYK